MKRIISISAPILSPFPSDHCVAIRTYSLVQVNGVFTSDNIGDGRALGLAGLLLGGHLWKNIR